MSAHQSPADGDLLHRSGYPEERRIVFEVSEGEKDCRKAHDATQDPCPPPAADEMRQPWRSGQIGIVQADGNHNQLQDEKERKNDQAVEQT